MVTVFNSLRGIAFPRTQDTGAAWRADHSRTDGTGLLSQTRR